jgi:quercetin dioxygenase-like cupin family protein
MHKTNTVDYAIVYDGEIWLELDNNVTFRLKRGDVVVQNGTRHAWRNKGTKPVTMLFFLNGVTPLRLHRAREGRRYGSIDLRAQQSLGFAGV